MLALRALASTPLPEARSEAELARAMAPAVREVAGVLGNTATVCRNSYIHPAVFEAWRNGRLPQAAEFGGWRRGEKLLLRLLGAAQELNAAGRAVARGPLALDDSTARSVRSRKRA